MVYSHTKVGLIGLGNHAHENIIPTLLMLKNTKITAVCDLDPQKAESTSREFGVKEYYSDYEEMLLRTNLDAVICVSHPEVHGKVARRCIELGIPVFVEKPPTYTTKELKELSDLALKKNAITGTGMNFRFASPVQKIKSIIDTPYFGNLKHLSIKHYCNKPKKPFWNLDSLVKSFLLAQTIHSLDLMIYFGEGIKKIDVSGFFENDTIFKNINLLFNNGMTGNLTTGTCSPHFILDLEFISDKSKIITLDSLWKMKILDVEKNYAFNETKKWGDTWEPSPLCSGFSRTGYFDELKTFIDAVRLNKPFSPSLTDMIPHYEALDEIEEKFYEAIGGEINIEECSLFKEMA